MDVKSLSIFIAVASALIVPALIIVFFSHFKSNSTFAIHSKPVPLTNNNLHFGLVFSVIILIAWLVLPWVFFYTTSGTFLYYLESFILALFMLMTLIAALVTFLRKNQDG